MSTTKETSVGRTYRLSPRDRTGWMFGLSLAQLAVVAVGVAGGALTMVMVSVPAGLVLLVGVGGVGSARWAGAPLLDSIPVASRFARSQLGGDSVWFDSIPVVGGGDGTEAPPALAGLELLVVDAGRAGIGAVGEQIAVSHDVTAGSLAATVRVTGRQFGLLEPVEQDWLLDAWGRALGAFVSERNPVVSIGWSQWAVPAGLDEHRAWLGDHLAEDPLGDVASAYEQLLREAGAQAVRHEVLVTVTLAVGRVGRRRGAKDRLSMAVDTLVSEMRLFSQRLEGSGLIVSAMLSPPEWARAMRVRLDPPAQLVIDGRARSLGHAAGGLSPDNAGPQATESTWTAWRADGSWHRALRVTEWPRIDVGAGWLSDLLLYAGSVRTLAVVLEPVPRSKSQRSIVRDAAKVESDAAHRAEKGFRVGAHHRRAHQAVEEREEELVAGYSEFVYAGLVCVTAATLDDLDAASDEISQIAASLGVEVRPLHGRHDLAMVATLPVARGVVPKEWM